jgi:hypothetical protein
LDHGLSHLHHSDKATNLLLQEPMTSQQTSDVAQRNLPRETASVLELAMKPIKKFTYRG